MKLFLEFIRDYKNFYIHQAWWCTPDIPELWSLVQEDCKKFKNKPGGFHQWSVTGYINHILGQALCPPAADPQKMNPVVFLWTFCFVLAFFLSQQSFVYLFLFLLLWVIYICVFYFLLIDKHTELEIARETDRERYKDRERQKDTKGQRDRDT